MGGHPGLEGGEGLHRLGDDDLEPLDVQHLAQRCGPLGVQKIGVELGRELATEHVDEGRATVTVGGEIAHDLTVVELLPQPISGREFVTGHG